MGFQEELNLVNNTPDNTSNQFTYAYILTTLHTDT
jgi:hypothetical protein